MPRPRRLALALPLGAAATSLALGLVTLGRKSIWYDESYTFFATRGSWSELWHLIVDHERPHAVYYALFKAWTAVAGTSEWAARLPSVVLAAAAAAALYFLGRRFMSTRAAALAAFALATNPFLVVSSQQARSYTLAVLGTVLSTTAFVGAVRRPGAARWAVYAAATVAAVAIHFMTVLVVAAHAAAFWSSPARRKHAAAPAAAFGVVGAFAVSAAVAVSDRSPRLTDWLERPSAGDVLKGVIEVAGYSVLPVAAAVLGLMVAWRKLERWQSILLAAWLVAPFAISVGVSFVRPAYSARYLVVAAPAFALLTALWLASLRRRSAAVAAAGTIVAWSLAVTVLWYRAPPIENWRDATSSTLAARRGGESIVIAPSTARIGFEYYAGLDVAEPTPRTRSVLVVAYGPNEPAQRERGRRAVGPGFELLESHRIDGALQVQRWRRP